MTPTFVPGFNPRAHEGRDDMLAYMFNAENGFNPRAHEGRDPARAATTRPGSSFNPRAHEGRDFGPQK